VGNGSCPPSDTVSCPTGFREFSPCVDEYSARVVREAKSQLLFQGGLFHRRYCATMGVPSAIANVTPAAGVSALGRSHHIRKEDRPGRAAQSTR
jgi:hypothetical protein